MNKPERLSVLVTGGAGFIGSHLCEHLMVQGHRIICVDNLQTGRRANIAGLTGRDGFEFIEHDIVKPLEIQEPLDRIYNLACPASPIHYQSSPVHTLRTCVEGAYNMLELARRTGARILQASTSEVYGDPEVHPQTEEYRGSVNITGIRACYDEGKRAAETLFFDYHRLYGTPIKVARIFNTYGPRMSENDGRVVSALVLQALRNEPLTIYGDGSQTRSFCYVDDLVLGLRLLMESAPDVTGPVNLGNPTELTIMDIAELILAETGSHSSLEHLPTPQDDPRRRRPVITRAQQLLDWTPKVDLAQGLRSTIDYFAGVLTTGERAQKQMATI